MQCTRIHMLISYNSQSLANLCSLNFTLSSYPKLSPCLFSELNDLFSISDKVRRVTTFMWLVRATFQQKFRTLAKKSGKSSHTRVRALSESLHSCIIAPELQVSRSLLYDPPFLINSQNCILWTPYKWNYMLWSWTSIVTKFLHRHFFGVSNSIFDPYSWLKWWRYEQDWFHIWHNPSAVMSHSFFQATPSIFFFLF